MNKNDSERIASFFDKNGLVEADMKEADVIVVNACSIRESAIDRIHGKMKNIRGMKKKPITILTGCVLQKDRLKVSSLFDHILETKDLSRWSLPFINPEDKEYFDIMPKRKNRSALISVMTGCNNFCSYCAVPYTKGREVSRSWEEVLKETEEAVKNGCREVWLLGQNVNSYKGGVSFADLLKKINEIKGNFWIRFTSSHPKDFSPELVNAMAECSKVTEYLNLPLQSGDNDVLKMMNRPYTANRYKEIIDMVREKIPRIAISTDIIVGFPGETEKQFRNTVKMVNEIRFEMAYISRYSPRPGTVSAKMEDNVPTEEKRRREKVLTEIIKEISLLKNKEYKGKKEEVLVLEKRKNGQLVGKTRGYKSVLLKGPKRLVGEFVKVKITHVSPWGLKGEKCS